MPAVKFTPRPYQAYTVDWILDRPRCALWQEMGLGKTASTLLAIKTLFWTGEVSRVLVAAPLRVVTMTWPDELAKWSDFSELEYVVIRGTPRERRHLVGRSAHIHIINHELLSWLVEHHGDKWPYDMVVLDEPRGVRDPSSRGFRTWSSVRALSPRMVQLTGTPAPNGLKGLWGPAYLLDGGRRLGATKEAFDIRWFHRNEVGVTVPRDNADAEIRERMQDIAVAMRSADYLDLPPMVKNTIPVQMPAEAVAQYVSLEAQMFIDLQEAVGKNVEAFSSAALTNKCLQCANGAVYLTAEDGSPLTEWTELHKAKLEALDEVISEAQGAPVMVAYWFKPELTRLAHRYKHAVVFDKDPDTLRRWNAGEIELLLVHPQSAGHGLNMQDGGNILVWFNLTWSLELYEQMNKRLHRSGQEKPVYIHHLAAAGTIDYVVLERLQGKAEVQQLLFEYMKAKVDVPLRVRA